ncbi:unnamed protein product [Pedinophyceae sp. YPF-701]|nr:unnamed protein product [Pedinophyceae sp. YPF-701]
MRLQDLPDAVFATITGFLDEPALLSLMATSSQVMSSVVCCMPGKAGEPRRAYWGKDDVLREGVRLSVNGKLRVPSHKATTVSCFFAVRRSDERSRWRPKINQPCLMVPLGTPPGAFLARAVSMTGGLFLFSIPSGMSSLTSLTLEHHSLPLLEHGWLPEDSRAVSHLTVAVGSMRCSWSQMPPLPLHLLLSLRSLILAGMPVQRVPDGLLHLEYLDVSSSGVGEDTEDWLPHSSSLSLKELRLANNHYISCVPDSARNLEVLDVRGATALDPEDWLAADTARNLRVLKITGVRRKAAQLITTLPLESLRELETTRLDAVPDVSRLEALVFSGSGSLPSSAAVAALAANAGGGLSRLTFEWAVARQDADKPEVQGTWLARPLVSALVELNVGYTDVRKLPREALNLRRLDVSGCPLEDDWLPCDVAKGLEYLDVSMTAIATVPTSLIRLQDLLVKSCRSLGQDWLSDDVASGLRTLNASWSTVTKVPSSARRLVELDLSGCVIAGQWLPPYLPYLRVLKVRHTDIDRVPARLPQLTKLDVVGCTSLSRDWLGEEAMASITDLKLTRCSRVPAACTNLRNLDIDSCNHPFSKQLPLDTRRSIQQLRIWRATNNLLTRDMECLTSFSETCYEGRVDAFKAMTSPPPALTEATLVMPEDFERLVRTCPTWHIFEGPGSNRCTFIPRDPHALDQDIIEPVVFFKAELDEDDESGEWSDDGSDDSDGVQPESWTSSQAPSEAPSE